MKHKKHQWQVVTVGYNSVRDDAVYRCSFVCHCGAYKQPKMYEVKE